MRGTPQCPALPIKLFQARQPAQSRGWTKAIAWALERAAHAGRACPAELLRGGSGLFGPIQPQVGKVGVHHGLRGDVGGLHHGRGVTWVGLRAMGRVRLGWGMVWQGLHWVGLQGGGRAV